MPPQTPRKTRTCRNAGAHFDHSPQREGCRSGGLLPKRAAPIDRTLRVAERSSGSNVDGSTASRYSSFRGVLELPTRRRRVRAFSFRRVRRLRAHRRERAVQRWRRRALPASRYALRLDSARPSASRTVGTTTISTGMRQIGDHSAQHRDLLRVLLSEKQRVGTGDGEQFGDDGRRRRENAADESRPRSASRSAPDRRWCETRADTSLDARARTADRRRPLEMPRGRARDRAGMRRNLRCGPNCSGLTKIERHDRCASLARAHDQREVPCVQRAHRRDEAERTRQRGEQRRAPLRAYRRIASQCGRELGSRHPQNRAADRERLPDRQQAFAERPGGRRGACRCGCRRSVQRGSRRLHRAARACWRET